MEYRKPYTIKKRIVDLIFGWTRTEYCVMYDDYAVVVATSRALAESTRDAMNIAYRVGYIDCMAEHNIPVSISDLSAGKVK
jgi:hypothetical protein